MLPPLSFSILYLTARHSSYLPIFFLLFYISVVGAVALRAGGVLHHPRGVLHRPGGVPRHLGGVLSTVGAGEVFSSLSFLFYFAFET